MSRPARITSQAVERNIRQQRVVDAQRHELSEFAYANAKLLAGARAQDNIEVRRRQTQQNACRTEQLFEERLLQEQQQKTMYNRTIQQNTALATQLDLEAAEEERHRKHIQRICEESPELRELERTLKIAYLNRERAIQHEEKILLAGREQERIQAMEEQMEYNRLHALKAEQDEIDQKKKIYKEQRYVLQRQIDERKLELQEAQRQTERDREMVDSIVNQINQEDQADFQRKRDMQAATAKMVREFEEQRKRELAAARAREKAEEDRIIEFQRSMDARSQGVAAKKQAKKDDEDRILRQIVEETERKRREEEEFNSLRDLLWEEELEAKRTADALRRVNKQKEIKREMMEANSKMMESKAALRMREAENEARMVAVMRHKFAEDERRERDEEEARRESKRNYQLMVERQRMERKAMTDQERQAEMEEMEEQRRREEYRKNVIKEARKRLLEEHAAKLQGYLPGGAFASEDEYDAFQRAAAMNSR